MEKLDERLQCNICFQVVEDPVRHLTCQKVFCAQCLNILLCQSATSNCPNCRSQIFQEDLALDSNIETLLLQTYIKCTCGETVCYNIYNGHIDKCEAYNQSFRFMALKPKEKVVNRWTFNCPGCDMKNLERKALVEHFSKSHRGFSGVCPVCASMPWGDSTYVSSNLSGHLKTRHNMDYDTLTVIFTQDYSLTDEEILKKVLEDSMKTC